MNQKTSCLSLKKFKTTELVTQQKTDYDSIIYTAILQKLEIQATTLLSIWKKQPDLIKRSPVKEISTDSEAIKLSNIADFLNLIFTNRKNVDTPVKDRFVHALNKIKISNYIVKNKYLKNNISNHTVKNRKQNIPEYDVKKYSVSTKRKSKIHL